MNKIRTKRDAKALVEKMLANPDLEIHLWDEMESSRGMKLTADAEYEMWCRIELVDYVTGQLWNRSEYVSEAVEAIWTNRKNVNKLNDLAIL